MTDKEYFSIDRISNSTLSWVKRKIKNLPDLPPNATYLEFGNICDSYIISGVPLPKGISIEWRDQIERMKKKFYENKMISSLVVNKNFKDQHIFLSDDFMGLPFKAKLDGTRMDIEIALEYKSILCKAEKDFRLTVDRLDYDRQCYIYSEVAKADTVLLVGQSKYISADVFPVVVNRGDKIWESGRVKTEELVENYKLYFRD